MNFRKSRKVERILYAIGLPLVFLSLGFRRPVVVFSLLSVGAVIVITAFYIVLRFWRCPHCGRGLPVRATDITHCPYCGKEL